MIPDADQIRIALELAKLIVLSDENLTGGSLSHPIDTAALEEADRGLLTNSSHVLEKHVNFDCRWLGQLDDELAGDGETSLNVALCAQ